MAMTLPWTMRLSTERGSLMRDLNLIIGVSCSGIIATTAFLLAVLYDGGSGGLIVFAFFKVHSYARKEAGVARQDKIERRQQFKRRVAQAVFVALPGRECAAFIVPNLDQIEAGIVVIAAEIEFADIMFVELTRELQRLLGGLGLEVAEGVVGGGEKLGSVGLGRCSGCLAGWDPDPVAGRQVRSRQQDRTPDLRPQF